MLIMLRERERQKSAVGRWIIPDSRLKFYSPCICFTCSHASSSNSRSLKYSFLSASVIVRITLQGFPAAMDQSGISLVTTLPAPITVLFPMCTPGQMTVFPPIHTLSPKTTSMPYSYMVLRVSGCTGCPAGQIATLGYLRFLLLPRPEWCSYSWRRSFFLPQCDFHNRSRRED